jgi:hypothetical protein
VNDTPGLPPFAAGWLQAQQTFAQFAGFALGVQPVTAAPERMFAEQYRQLFAMPGLPFAAAVGGMTAAPSARFLQALERFGRVQNAIALDAARRLGAALADESPDAPPITTLRALHELWIDCGDAAWSEAAHGEEFAAALAELVGALAALRPPAWAP